MTAPTERLSRLPGGLRLPPNKSMSTASAIADVAVPPLLKLPLRQHAGSTAEPVVAVGQRVRKGELLATGGGPVSAGVHASTSGVVTAIEPLPMPARGEPIVATIVLEADGEDTPAPELGAVADPLSLDTAEFLERIEAGGIVGLGGAAYPTAQKITHAVGSGVRALLLNGVECESYISCDDRLMREHAAEVLRGAVLLLHGLEAPRAIIAVESDKPQALEALKEAAAALADERIELVEVPTVYPSGGEDQLVLLLSGSEVPSGGLPSDVGYLVHNVGTAYAVARLIDAGEPLISRVVTVTGEGIERPGNYRIRLGTPIADVVAAAGGYNDRARRLLMGGPMTGIALTDDALPVVKAMNCLLITGAAVHLSAEPERPCIRCGECALHCPVQLLPQQLYRETMRNAIDGLLSFGLDDCIECGCCDLVCPSHIPLTETFRRAKQAAALREHERQRAERARRRFEARAERAAERAAADESLRRERTRGVDNSAIRAILRRKREKDKKDD